MQSMLCRRLGSLLLNRAVLFSLSLPVLCLADNLDQWTVGCVHYGRAVCSSPGRLVAVDDGSSILSSTNGADWVEANAFQNPLTNGFLRDVEFGNGIFVAVGEFGATRSDILLTSEDGVNWVWEPPLVGIPRSVCFANGTFAIVGGGGKVWHSADGTNWLQGLSPTFRDLCGVGYGNGEFVAVSTDGSVITSGDGVSWTFQTILAPLQTVTYGNGQFIVSGSGLSYWCSPDGAQWTQFTIPWSDASRPPALQSIRFNHDLFTAVASYGLLFTSQDGRTWQQKTTIPANTWNDSVLWNDTLILVGSVIAQSQPFSGERRPPSFSGGPASALVRANEPVSLVATGICIPPLSFQWQMNGARMPGCTNTVLSFLAALTNAADYTLVASNANGSATSRIARVTVVYPTSPLPPTALPPTLNGTLSLCVLVSSNSPADYQWRFNGEALAGATGSAMTLTNIQLSQSGTYDMVVSNSIGCITSSRLFVTVEPYFEDPLYRWQDCSPVGFETIFDGVALFGTAYGKGTFVTVGNVAYTDFGVILTSPDGVTWTERMLPEPGLLRVLGLYDVAFGNGRFVAVGEGMGGAIYVSYDGIDWTGTSRGGDGFDRVVYDAPYFWAHRYTGETLRSQTGISWQTYGSWPGYLSVPLSIGGFFVTISNAPSQLNWLPSSVLVSTNQNNWETVLTSDTYLSDIALGNSGFVAVGRKRVAGGPSNWRYAPVILKSAPLVRLDILANPPKLALRGVVGGRYGIKSQTDVSGFGLNWTTPILLTNNPVLVPIDPQQPSCFYKGQIMP